MSRKRAFRIAGPAFEEFTDPVRWYETRRPGLGADLYDAINATIEGIERQPEIGKADYVDPTSRRVLVARFPITSSTGWNKMRSSSWRSRT